MTNAERAKELVNTFGKINSKKLKNGGYKYNVELSKLYAIQCINEIRSDVMLIQLKLGVDLSNKMKDLSDVIIEIDKL